jgi:hypothetical protein
MAFRSRTTTALAPPGPTAVARPVDPPRWGPLLSSRSELDIHFQPKPHRAAFAVCFPLLLAAQLLGLALPLPFTLHLAPIAVGLWGLIYLIDPGLWRRRRMRRLPAGFTNALTDDAVRVVGVIERDGEPFGALGVPAPVVYARTTFRRARSDGTADLFIRQEVRGVPFVLRRADGDAFHVDPAPIWLLDEDREVADAPPALRRTLGAPTRGIRRQIGQATLCPGDLIEAVGRIVREVSSDGAAAPGRGTPIRQRLVPAWENGVWIRRMAGPARSLARTP